MVLLKKSQRKPPKSQRFEIARFEIARFGFQIARFGIAKHGMLQDHENQLFCRGPARSLNSLNSPKHKYLESTKISARYKEARAWRLAAEAEACKFSSRQGRCPSRRLDQDFA